MKISRIFIAFVLSLSFLTFMNESVSAQEDETTYSIQNTQKIVEIYDRLVQSQRICMDNQTYEMQFWEKKYVVNTYNSSGKLINSETFIETRWEQVHIANGCITGTKYTEE